MSFPPELVAMADLRANGNLSAYIQRLIEADLSSSPPSSEVMQALADKVLPESAEKLTKLFFRFGVDQANFAAKLLVAIEGHLSDIERLVKTNKIEAEYGQSVANLNRGLAAFVHPFDDYLLSIAEEKALAEYRAAKGKKRAISLREALKIGNDEQKDVGLGIMDQEGKGKASNPKEALRGKADSAKSGNSRPA